MTGVKKQYIYIAFPEDPEMTHKVYDDIKSEAFEVSLNHLGLTYNFQSRLENDYAEFTVEVLAFQRGNKNED